MGRAILLAAVSALVALGFLYYQGRQRSKLMTLYSQITVVCEHLDEHVSNYGRYPSVLSELTPIDPSKTKPGWRSSMPFEQAIGKDPWGRHLGYFSNGADYLLWSTGADRELDSEWMFRSNDDEYGSVDTVIVTGGAHQWYWGSSAPNVFGSCPHYYTDGIRIGKELERDYRDSLSPGS